MAEDIVIRAEGLGKKYVIGHEAQRERYVALRDVIARSVRNIGRIAADMARGRVVVPGDTIEEFWALKDVSFEVKRGEVLGIIGRNGAGKSTLLKVLSRITEPSEGRVTIKGRVASLLEVGTGFHPELTGRENIYLNGAVLGMTRAEIKRKFDEIVAFAEVDKFLDTPVKRYSSGMYVRLAFAVAAHLEPEILVVDEVLSVGDAEFQKKCLGKMGEVASGGRTVLFVSHNIGSLQAICESGILLNAGRLTSRGPIGDVAREYRTSASEKSNLSTRAFDGPLRSIRLGSIQLNGTPTNSYCSVRPSMALKFSIHGQADLAIASFQFLFSIYADGVRLVTIHDGPRLLDAGEFVMEIDIPSKLLRPGIYSIAFGARDTFTGEWLWGMDILQVEVIPEWSETFHMDDIGLINLPPTACQLVVSGQPVSTLGSSDLLSATPVGSENNGAH
jgi:ABC-type polysaccharide/polyol phosphate transport system ATPase subunit